MTDSTPRQRPTKLFSFIQYAGYETRRALDCFSDAEQLTKVKTEMDAGVGREWRSVMNALRLGYISAANVSKALWPSAKASKRRHSTASEMRLLCDIPNDHPIRSRTVRNSFEHLDERLEEWLDDEQNYYLAADLIEYEVVERPTPIDCCAPIVLHVPSNVLRVMGADYPIAEICSDLSSIQEHIGIGMGKILASWDAGRPIA